MTHHLVELRDKIQSQIESKEYGSFTRDELFKMLQSVSLIITAGYEKLQVPFICGIAGENDQIGLPEYFFICPTYGMDGHALYKKHKTYTAPEW